MTVVEKKVSPARRGYLEPFRISAREPSDTITAMRCRSYPSEEVQTSPFPPLFIHFGHKYTHTCSQLVTSAVRAEPWRTKIRTLLASPTSKFFKDYKKRTNHPPNIRYIRRSWRPHTGCDCFLPPHTSLTSLETLEIVHSTA